MGAFQYLVVLLIIYSMAKTSEKKLKILRAIAQKASTSGRLRSQNSRRSLGLGLHLGTSDPQLP